MAFALTEYFLELWLVPDIKFGPLPDLVGRVGLSMLVLGELVRKTGMMTAKGCFTHMIRHRKDPDHVLVTWGIYSWVRHPGYLGWLVWSVGTQVMLGNPLSVVAFAYASWSFFRDRIEYEEEILCRWFPQYEDYRRKTPTGIIGIR